MTSNRTTLVLKSSSPGVVTKQMLQLRTELPLSHSPTTTDSPHPTAGYEKQQLQFIEKENRKSVHHNTWTPYSSSCQSQPSPFSDQMSVQNQQHLGSRRVLGEIPNSNKFQKKSVGEASSTSGTSPSDTSSSGGSHSPFSGGASKSQKPMTFEDINDPAVEVDLEPFITPNRNQAQVQPHQLHSALTQLQQKQQAVENTMRNQMYHHDLHYPATARSNKVPASYSLEASQMRQAWNEQTIRYGHSQAQSHTNAQMASQRMAAASQQSQAHQLARTGYCTWCWSRFVKTCNRSQCEPVFQVNGPWLWHTTFDDNGAITCPRLWFDQLEQSFGLNEGGLRTTRNQAY